MLMLFIMQIGKGGDMEYWQKIDIVTIKRIIDLLIEASNALDEEKMPIDVLLEYATNKIDLAIDELDYYYKKGTMEEEDESK